MIVRPTRDPAVAIKEASVFFRIPEWKVRRDHPEEVWKTIIEPAAREFETKLAKVKPTDIPGTFRFEFAEDASWWLVYRE
jgi:hypothetical protein